MNKIIGHRFAHQSTNIFKLILLYIFLAEATGIKTFLIQIPGFPLTVGRVCLILVGALGWYRMFNTDKTIFSKGIYLMLFGILLGCFASTETSASIITFVGVSILIFSGLGLSCQWNNKHFLKALDIFFIFCHIYWTLYVLGFSLFGGDFVSYGYLYRYERFELGLVNYHSFGLILSMSTIYIICRFFLNKKFSIFGIVFTVIALTTLFITESRANFIITLFLLFVAYFIKLKLSVSRIIYISIILLISLYIFNFYTSKSENLATRFDIKNTEYIDQTTSSRVEFFKLSFIELQQNPFGLGPNLNTINYYGKNYQPHNQYLTFILGGGYITFCGIILWIFGYFRSSISILKEVNLTYLPYVSIIWIFLITLLTNDISGALLFFVISLQGWIVINSTRLQKKRL